MCHLSSFLCWCKTLLTFMRKFKDLLINTFDKRKVWAGQRHRLLLYSPPCCQQGTLVWALTRQPSPMLLPEGPFSILSIQYSVSTAVWHPHQPHSWSWKLLFRCVKYFKCSCSSASEWKEMIWSNGSPDSLIYKTEALYSCTYYTQCVTHRGS